MALRLLTRPQRHHVHPAGGPPPPIPCVGALLQGAKGHLGIEGSQGHGTRFDLGHAHAFGRMQYLALQVGQVDLVAVDERQPADPG